jgi:NAD(P)-dependent dehydrogenase (short-subunit alcohol dehydrogenase family)
MAHVFITGSSDGLGLMAGRLLVEEGHTVVLHARTAAKAEATRNALRPLTAHVVVGDLSTLAAMRDVAEQANALGRFDAVIHNVGVGYREPQRVETVDGLSQVWAVNVLAPYVLTALMHEAERLVYLSSGLHVGGDPGLADVQWADRLWNGSQAYSDTKLHDVLLAFGVARRRPDAFVNAMTPGWVATRMGGAGASDDLAQGPVTQVWLAVSDDASARTTGGYFYHKRPATVHPAAHDVALQDALIAYCADVSGITLTETPEALGHPPDRVR